MKKIIPLLVVIGAVGWITGQTGVYYNLADGYNAGWAGNGSYAPAIQAIFTPNKQW